MYNYLAVYGDWSEQMQPILVPFKFHNTAHNLLECSDSCQFWFVSIVHRRLQCKLLAYEFVACKMGVNSSENTASHHMRIFVVERPFNYTNPVGITYKDTRVFVNIGSLLAQMLSSMRLPWFVD